MATKALEEKAHSQHPTSSFVDIDRVPTILTGSHQDKPSQTTAVPLLLGASVAMRGSIESRLNMTVVPSLNPSEQFVQLTSSSSISLLSPGM